MERQRLAASGQLDAAEALCARWIDCGNAVARAEGYKCSANVLVARGKDVGDTLMIPSDYVQRLAVGGMASTATVFGPIDSPIAQLDHAAQLDPSQLSIHQGRLFLAVASGDYARAVGASH